jgi:hypothetical protein
MAVRIYIPVTVFGDVTLCGLVHRYKRLWTHAVLLLYPEDGGRKLLQNFDTYRIKCVI